MREECNESNLDFVVAEGHLPSTDLGEFEPEPSKVLTYALAIGLTAGFYWIYVLAFLFLRDELRLDNSVWHYRIAGSGLTIGLAFYLVSIAIPSLYLKPVRVVTFLQLDFQETTSFWIKIWERRQSLKRWDEKSRGLKNTGGGA